MSTPGCQNPLWTVVAKLFENSLAEIEEDDKVAQCRTIWRERVLSNVGNLYIFHSVLSHEQLASQKVLEEWFRFQLRFQQFEDDADRALNQLVDNSVQPSPVSYHICLARLYVAEFSNLTLSDIRVEPSLHALRRTALQLAACQRTSLALFESTLGPLATNDESSPISFGLGLPRHRACLEPCYWLAEDKREGTPFYLWDAQKMETVRVADLVRDMGECPQYTAVSHTWGRWQVAHSWIDWPGVPWRIPENSKFKLPELAEGLTKTGWNYVWLDLFTIPQDPTNLSEEMSKVRKDEIGRQATIFINATQAVAWLKEANNWKGLRSVMCYLSFAFLKEQTIKERDGPTIDEMLTAFRTLLNDFDLGVCNPSDTEIRLDPWFESLWALQEVCLRPDMLLYNRNWEPFNVAPTLPATLSDIVALLKSTQNLVDGKGERLPGSAFVLDWAFRFSGMDNLLLMSPTAILYMGYKRYCRRRRAEAIMCAVGVSDWFSDDHDDVSATGRYPPAFINAVRAKFGSSELFLSMPRRVDVQKARLEEIPKAIGSLLPFGEERDSSTFECDNFAIYNLVEHPSVHHWTIENSGSVRIPTAGIISTSYVEHSTPLRVTIHGASPAVTGDIWKGWALQKDVDIHEYLKSYGSWGRTYAVCIQQMSSSSTWDYLDGNKTRSSR